MATTAGCPRGPERTRALLEEIAGGRRGLKLRAQVLRAKAHATDEEVEDAFQEACLKAASRCRGQTMGEVYTWLRMATDSNVDDMRDRRKHEVLVDPSIGEFQGAHPALAPPDELLIKREERAEVDRLTIAILDRLPERERNVAVLHSHGLARKEIAVHLSLTPRVVKRSIEELLAVGRTQLTKLVGYGCPDGHDLVARYAFGLAVGREARRAQVHLMTCPRCCAMYEGLDLWRERVAAVVPLPPLAAAHAHLVERAVHAGTELATGGPSRGSESPAGVRRHITAALGHLREHAAAAYYRTVDPTPLAGVRPGAVAAAVAGCLAIGGGATYCVQQGADPLTALGRLGGTTQSHREKPKPRAKRAHLAQAPTPQPVSTPTVTAPPQTVQTPPPTQTTTTTAAPPPAPEDQFEPTSAGATSQTAQTASSTPKQPAPAPQDGPGEFGGP